MGFFNRKKNDEGQKAPASAKASVGKPAKADKKEVKAAALPIEASAKMGPRETGHAYRILVRPIVTEKSTLLGKVNQYVFEVAMSANKLEVRKAVKAVYGVEPTDVRVMRIAGKPVRTRTGKSRRSMWRKAIVTLKKGDRLDVYASA